MLYLPTMCVDCLYIPGEVWEAKRYLSHDPFFLKSCFVIARRLFYVRIVDMYKYVPWQQRHIRKDKRRASVLSLCSVHIACSKYLTKIQLYTYICILIQNWLSTNIISENNI